MLLRNSVVSDPGTGSPGARDKMKERLAAPLSSWGTEARGSRFPLRHQSDSPVSSFGRLRIRRRRRAYWKLFNGTDTAPLATSIYQGWLQQESDVVVVNFLNTKNAADLRVYQLLDEKFRLFEGVFGASDEVLGAVESGVDFEKRIAGIYQQCRTTEQIQFELDQLQRDLETQISTGHRDAREKLLDNFDREVVEKVRVDSTTMLDRFNDQLWRLTRHVLAEHASFADDGFSFLLHTNPFPGETINRGPYRMAKGVEDANTYRVGHPLAQRVLARARELEPQPAEVAFDYAGSGRNIAILEPLRGRSGWLACAHVGMSALESEDQLVFAGVGDDGVRIDQAQCRRLFDLPAEAGALRRLPDAVAAELEHALTAHRQTLLAEMTARDGHWFDTEMDKFDRWAEDRRDSLKAELADMDEALKEAKKLARFAPTLPEKLERQRAALRLEEKREEAWRAYDEASRDIDRQKDELLDEIGRRLEQGVEQTALFTLRWRLT